MSRGTGSANISKVWLSKFINNDNFKAIRQSLEEGEWPNEHCKSCPRSKSPRGQESYRQKINKHLKFTHTNDAIKKRDIEYIEVRFSNACNLSCRQSSKTIPSKWNSILKRVERVHDDYSHDIKNREAVAPNHSGQKNKLTSLLI